MTDLTPLARDLAAYIHAYPKQRTPLDDLIAHAYTQHRNLLGDPTARTQIATALTTLADDGHLTLPATQQAWETHTRPPLPRWVAKPTTTKTTRPQPAARVWPERLQPAAALATRPDEIDTITRIADWLRDHPHPQPVPMEERSLEVFGYEKTLDTLIKNRLFTSGALTLDLLAAHPTPMPLPSAHIPGIGATALLVCENRAAYHSVVTAARRLPEGFRPDLHVAFGGGGQFAVSHAQIAFLDPTPTRIRYCGDLDRAGLNIARKAATRYAETTNPDDPALAPAVAHYEWMLTHGTPQPDPSNRTSDNNYALQRWLHGWLPAHLHRAISELLRTRTRISQETVGLDALTATPRLITSL